MRHAEASMTARATELQGMTTRRRVMILAVAAVAAGRAWPAAKPRRIGLLAFAPRPKPGVVPLFDGFLAGMRELGYEEDRDFTMEWKVTEGKPERYASAAAELVASRVDLILCFASPAALAAKSATSTIPIVFAGLNDPVTSGLVPSLARPGGNLTGLSGVDDELHGKRLSLLRELLPAVSNVVVLWSPDVVVHRHEVAQIETLARGLAIQVRPVELRRVEDVGPVFEQLERPRPGAVLVPAAAWHAYHSAALFAAATRARLPAIGTERFHAVGGALLTYGADLADLARRAAGYVDKIFKGAKPADLPIQQPTKYDLLINLKTADAIGVTIPKDLLLRADEVIR